MNRTNHTCVIRKVFIQFLKGAKIIRRGVSPVLLIPVLILQLFPPFHLRNNEKRDDHVLLRRISPRLVARGTELVEIIPVSISLVALGRIQPRTKRQRRGNQGCDGATERTKKIILLCALSPEIAIYTR